MKKLFLSFLAVMGIFSVLSGSIEVHAQSTEIGSISDFSESVDVETQLIGIEPMCQPQQGPFPTARLLVNSWLYLGAGSSTTTGTRLDAGTLVSVTNSSGTWRSVRAISGGINAQGWIPAYRLTVITC